MHRRYIMRRASFYLATFISIFYASGGLSRRFAFNLRRRNAPRRDRPYSAELIESAPAEGWVDRAHSTVLNPRRTTDSLARAPHEP